MPQNFQNVASTKHGHCPGNMVASFSHIKMVESFPILKFFSYIKAGNLSEELISPNMYECFIVQQ